MAQISICDICKQPSETDFKLDIYKTGGGRGRKSVKISGDICEGCVEVISNAITAAASNPKPLGKQARQSIASDMAKLGAATLSGAPLGDGELPPQVADGVFKVPSNLSPHQVKKMNREASKDTSCKHPNKTMEDSGVICRDCRKPVEE